ncbi:hypothetical protein RF007C_13360 [Ruminococcus flavefaciens 007c]|uniref:Uncharacterized protein n=1 Tax=Ruminococcus flavefaciens 007c TaxID=1341157 RepID=W7UEH7_RUMFL|nr:hypothetical protein RF007C_13360 [Ruminococcus flavefaciens 007c]
MPTPIHFKRVSFIFAICQKPKKHLCEIVFCISIDHDILLLYSLLIFPELTVESVRTQVHFLLNHHSPTADNA